MECRQDQPDSHKLREQIYHNVSILCIFPSFTRSVSMYQRRDSRLQFVFLFFFSHSHYMPQQSKPAVSMGFRRFAYLPDVCRRCQWFQRTSETPTPRVEVDGDEEKRCKQKRECVTVSMMRMYARFSANMYYLLASLPVRIFSWIIIYFIYTYNIYTIILFHIIKHIPVGTLFIAQLYILYYIQLYMQVCLFLLDHYLLLNI